MLLRGCGSDGALASHCGGRRPTSHMPTGRTATALPKSNRRTDTLMTFAPFLKLSAVVTGQRFGQGAREPAQGISADGEYEIVDGLGS